MKDQYIPIGDKFVLSIREASEYFHIGQNKLRAILKEYDNYGCSFTLGNRTYVKREAFEKFIRDAEVIQ